jgi:hypothetical protein
VDIEKETIKTKGCEPLLDAFRFVGISRCNGIPNSKGVFKLRSNLGKIKHVQTFKGEEEKVTLRTKLNEVIHSQNNPSN